VIQLPSHIKQAFFQVMYEQTDLPAFEQWVYSTEELERILPEDLYLELIALNYQKSGAKYELFHLLERYVDMGEYETYKLKHLLRLAKQRTLELPGVLEEFYDLYCYGYKFLGPIGINYGLMMVSLPMPYQADHWSGLNEKDLQALANDLSETLEDELAEVEEWLNTGKIVLTGKQDELRHYGYIDNRTNAEKTSRWDAPIFKKRS
jgi:hypothetical protein